MTVPALTGDQHEAIIAFQLGHLGMAEDPLGSNNTEPGRWYGLNNNAWCAMFQSWSHHSVLGYSPFPATCSKGFSACVSGARWFRRQGAWAGADVTPKRGWLIFFIWPGDTIEHHIGKVLDATGPRQVSTVEGNTSDRVQLHTRRGSSIAGYGVIDTVSAARPAPITAPPWEAPAFPGHTMAQGEQGQAVAVLKVLLIAAGFGGGVDISNALQARIFENGTREALKKIQELHDRSTPSAEAWGPPTGKVGPKTWAWLCDLVRLKQVQAAASH